MMRVRLCAAVAAACALVAAVLIPFDAIAALDLVRHVTDGPVAASIAASAALVSLMGRIEDVAPLKARRAEIMTELETLAAAEQTDEVRRKFDRLEAEARAIDLKLAAPPADPAPGAPVDEAAVRAAERTRIREIEQLGARLGVDAAFVRKHVDGGTAFEAFSRLALAEVAARTDDGAQRPTRITGGDDHDSPQARRAAMAEALAARAAAFAPGVEIAMTERARPYAELSVLEMLGEYARQSGERIGPRLRGGALYDQLVQLRGLATSDFPIILANAQNKVLQQAYQLQSQTYRAVGARRTFNDFKPTRFIRPGDFPNLLQRGEKAEFQFGAIGETQQQVTLTTYGRIVGMSRQTLVNDDLNFFAEIPTLAARRVSDFENATFWALVTSASGAGPTLTETTRAVFNTTDGTLAGTGTVIDVTSVGAARAAMMAQRSVGDGSGPASGLVINVLPRFIVTGPARFTQAQIITAAGLLPSAPSGVNPFSGALEAIGDGNLTGNAWYLFADPALFPTFIYGYLAGAEGPQMMSEEGFTYDGVNMRVMLDYAVGAIDYRGAYRNPGA
ncbi:MAG: hypothetical protein IM628_12755 [Phenylobacterium sp.]|uniref:phage major capsid protein n=1 Tax=Phenylobacterium sp. TaxID=1871053 RepID=UPI0025E5C863|nr:hypothetical protein [Phenylobacterium sp.]MCA6305668.1 hypothetical protein [Phenylobacterium sp.]